MTTIYYQFDKHFAKASAYALMYAGKYVGTIAIKYPADGAGRLYAYIHIHGTEMQRAHAGGYGYDKSAHALQKAMGSLPWDEIAAINGQDFARKLADIRTYLDSHHISSAFFNSGIDCQSVI